MENVVNGIGLEKQWSGRSVFLTGHTGFKGSWLAIWLARLGAHVHGYALAHSPSDLTSLERLLAIMARLRGAAV